MQIIVDTIAKPGGGTLVIPQKYRAEALSRQLIKEAVASEALAAQCTEPGIKAEHEKRAQELRSFATSQVEELERLRSQHADKIVSTSYEVNPYTYGQKKAAFRKHTSFQGGTPRVDQEAVFDELAACALGWTVEKFDELPAPVAVYLKSEILDEMEPGPEKLDFLD